MKTMGKIQEYYKDQIKFYSIRLKRAQKTLKDIENMGLETDLDLYHVVIQCEEENVERYTKKLEAIS